MPRVPWEGGPSYWNRFPRTARGGWTNPSFFPIALWFGGIANNAEARFDKGVGINTYILMNDKTPYQLFHDNQMFWVGGRLNPSFTPDSRYWVGDFLDDEVDGRFAPERGLAHLRRLRAAFGDDGRFKYANYTQTVTTTDMTKRAAEAYVNDVTDVTSVDMYWYSVPACGQDPYYNTSLVAVPQRTCRSAASYGKTVRALRQRDAADGKLQPLWQFVELSDPDPGGTAHRPRVTPAELKGAVMSSVISEARGIVYFNQILSGDCANGNVVRWAQVAPGTCAAAQVDAARVVNAQLRELAPVLNTQSYAVRLGAGLRTMTKRYGDHAYILAMVGDESAPGSRQFTLPVATSASEVEVMFENRRLPLHHGRRFSDSFSAENTYHVYKVAL